MSRIRPLKTNFTAGELDPLILNRSELQLHQNGAAKMRNAIAFPQGGFRWRDGMEFMNTIPPDGLTIFTGIYEIEIVNGGSGYGAGAILDVVGGVETEKGQIIVERVNDNGAVQAAFLSRAGAYTTLPPSTFSTSGSGTGATFSFNDTNTLDVVRVVPFEFSIRQNYLMVFTAPLVYIFRKEDTGAGPNQLVDVASHPFKNDQLLEMTWTQSLDLMLVFHKDVGTSRIARVGETDWTIFGFSYSNIPTSPFGVVQTTSIVITFPDADIQAGNFVKVTGGAFTTNDIGSFLNVIRPAVFSGTFAGSDFSSYYKIINFTNATDIDVQIIIAPIIVSIPAPVFPFTLAVGGQNWLKEEPKWSSTRGFPRCGAFFQGRLCVAGTTSFPDSLFASRAGDIEDFNSLKTSDDFGIDVAAGSDTLVTFQSMNAGRHLQLFGDSAESYVPITETEPMTPTTVSLNQTTSIGSKLGIPVFDIEGLPYFVHRSGGSINKFVFNDGQKAYTADTISLHWSHLLKNPNDVAFKKSIR